MTRTLRVFPNPWKARDHRGRPCGVCPRDTSADRGAAGQLVGARIDRERTQVLQELRPGDDIRSPLQDTIYSFLGIPNDDPELAQKLTQAEPIELPRTPYYRQRLIDGALIAADEETARSVGLKFQDPKAKILALGANASSTSNTPNTPGTAPVAGRSVPPSSNG